MTSNNAKRKILFLAANPMDTQRLQLDTEIREIDAGLRRNGKFNMFELTQRWAIGPIDLQRAMLDIKPNIVHFSGHGAASGGLVLQDSLGQSKLVEPEALAELFRLCKKNVECVLLNACYSATQADAITNHINYVIGMSDAIADSDAIEFAVGFYDALADGKSVEIAYEFGCSAIQLEGCPDHLIPVLERKTTSAPSPSPSPPPPITPVLSLPPMEPTGVLPLQSAFYVERPMDQIALNEISDPGPGITLSIRASGQMGASSLLERVMDAASRAGKRVVHIDFQQAFDPEDFKNLGSFYRRFCAVLTDQIKEDRVDEYVDENWERNKNQGLGVRCTKYAESLLKSLGQDRLVLAMDEVDRLIDTGFRTSFFGMLRNWHNQRVKNEGFKRLDLIIVTSLEPNQLIDDFDQSPFNIGYIVDLRDFLPDQVRQLSDLYGVNPPAQQLESLFALIGGHPYLWQLSLHRVAKRRCTFDKLLETTGKNPGLYSPHLSAWYEFLQSKPQLREALKNILGKRDYDDRAFLSLRRVGLVSREGNQVRLRCELYESYFREQLNVRKA